MNGRPRATRKGSVAQAHDPVAARRATLARLPYTARAAFHGLLRSSRGPWSGPENSSQLRACHPALRSFSSRLLHAPVAQLDRASDYGSEGLGFDSLRVRHFEAPEVQRLRGLLCFLSASRRDGTGPQRHAKKPLIACLRCGELNAGNTRPPSARFTAPRRRDRTTKDRRRTAPLHPRSPRPRDFSPANASR